MKGIRFKVLVLLHILTILVILFGKTNITVQFGTRQGSDSMTYTVIVTPDSKHLRSDIQDHRPIPNRVKSNTSITVE